MFEICVQAKEPDSIYLAIVYVVYVEWCSSGTGEH